VSVNPTDLAILLVDDNPADAALTQEMLADSGGRPWQVHRVEVADSLQAACARVAAERFDVVLLDLNLPDSHGPETVQAWLEGPAVRPLIALTGEGGWETGSTTIQYGAQDFLPKDELTPELISRTVQQALERWKLEREHRILAAAFQTGQATMITDASGRIQRVNAAFTAITGYSEAEVVGNDPRLMGSGLHDSDFFHAVWVELEQEGSWQGEVWNRHKTGRLLPVWQTIAAVTDQSGAVEHYVSVFHDISEQKRLEDEMAWLAATDPLTGLANRRRFLKAAREEVAGAPSHGQGVSLIMLDVDHFKVINDTHGHESGDLALTALSEILTRNLREEELVGRIGGEEFAVLLPGTDPRRAAAVAERLRSLVAETAIHGTDTTFQLTISLGIAAWRGPHETVDRLLARADEELYAAKQAGRNRIRGGIVA